MGKNYFLSEFEINWLKYEIYAKGINKIRKCFGSFNLEIG